MNTTTRQCPEIRTTEIAQIQPIPPPLIVVSGGRGGGYSLVPLELSDNPSRNLAQLERALRDARIHENETLPRFVTIASVLWYIRSLPQFQKRGQWCRFLQQQRISRREYSDYRVALRIFENIQGNTTVLPASQAQLMPLRKLSPEQCVQTWDKAVAAADGRVPTAAFVLKCRAAVLGPRTTHHRADAAKTASRSPAEILAITLETAIRLLLQGAAGAAIDSTSLKTELERAARRLRDPEHTEPKLDPNQGLLFETGEFEAA